MRVNNLPVPVLANPQNSSSGRSPVTDDRVVRKTQADEPSCARQQPDVPIVSRPSNDDLATVDRSARIGITAADTQAGDTEGGDGTCQPPRPPPTTNPAAYLH